MNRTVFLAPATGKTLVNRLLAPFFPRYSVLIALEQEPLALRDTYRNLIMTHDRKLLFLRNQKCACTQTTQVLYAYSNAGATYPGNVHRANRGILPARYNWQKIKPVLQARSAYTFTFVRHPEKRAHSAFRNFFVDATNIARHKHMPHITSHGYDATRNTAYNFDVFLDYVAHTFAADALRCDTHWRLQTLNIGWGTITFDHVGKVETYNADLGHVFDAIGRTDFPPADLLKRRFNATDSAVMPVTPAQRKKIEALYVADFEAFSY